MASTPSLATTLAGIPLDICLSNASGPRCTEKQELIALRDCPSTGYVVSKSCTLEPREGNPEPRYREVPMGSINSMGIPNHGYHFYGELAAEINAANAETGKKKPYIISVSGQTLADNKKIIEYLNNIEGVTAIELNLSCPNVIGKPQIGYDFEQTKQVLDVITSICTKPLGVKLPPYFDIIHFEQMASILSSYEQLKFITCINSIGNALIIDPETETALIKPKGGFGGLGGDFVKPTSLANVRKFYELLPSRIDVIGCGGVKSGIDAFEHILCGAAAVQVGTQLAVEDTVCFERIANELRAVMQRKGYNSISDFRGKLKAL